jgi:quaternary ammonium compound-resistance protein SugE
MNAWLALLLAGMMELTWPLGLKYSEGLTRLWPTIATGMAIALSFFLLGQAIRQIPFGTAYAIWTGIGTIGTVILGILWLGESANALRLACIALIVTGIIGLKLVSPE